MNTRRSHASSRNRHGGPRLLSLALATFLTLSVAGLGVSWGTDSTPNLIAHAVAAPPAPAGFTWVVNMTGDGAGGGPPSVGCDVDPLTPGPQCTLRRALNLTNNVAGEDTITFNILMTQPNCDAATGRCTINLTEALPDITDGVSINGPGADKLTVRGTGDSGAGVGSGIFVVQTTETVTLSGMTVSKGLNNTSDGGGAIRNNGGTVNVTNSTFTDNIASSSGGGIFNFGGGTVNITKSTLMNNRGGFGGHIYNGGGTLNVTDSTLSGASASLGGGIFNAGTANITNSTLSNNIASSTDVRGGGGGIYNFAVAGIIANVTNSTISGNIAFSNGGGTYNPGNTPTMPGGTVNVINSTITNNTASAFGGIYTGDPGLAAGPVNVRSTIIALNATSNEAQDVGGVFTSSGFNLVGKTGGSTGFTQPTDQTGTTALAARPKA